MSFNLSKLEFFESDDENPDFEVLLANTLEDEKSIKIVLTHPLASQNLEMDLFDLKLNDESTDISAVEIDSNNNNTLVKMIDVLGKEHKYHPKGKILFYIYQDGTTKKRVLY